MWRSRWRCVIKPAYSVSFLLSINIFLWQNVLYFLDAPRRSFVNLWSLKNVEELADRPVLCARWRFVCHSLYQWLGPGLPIHNSTGQKPTNGLYTPTHAIWNLAAIDWCVQWTKVRDNKVDTIMAKVNGTEVCKFRPVELTKHERRHFSSRSWWSRGLRL